MKRHNKMVMKPAFALDAVTPRLQDLSVKTVLARLVVLGLLSCVPIGRADQFAYIPRTVCTNALNYVSAGSVVISFCSQCDGEHLEVWRVKEAFVADVQYENQFQLTVFAKRLYRSRKGFDKGAFREPLRLEKVRDGEKSFVVEGVDLAYLYIRRPDGAFHVLAKEMSLDWLHCAVETIRLPAAVSNSLRD